MSFVWNYFYGNTISEEPTPALIHQKHLIIKQLKASNLRLRSVKEIKETEDRKNDQVNSWKNMIKHKKKNYILNKNKVKNNI